MVFLTELGTLLFFQLAKVQQEPFIIYLCALIYVFRNVFTLHAIKYSGRQI